MRLIKMLGLAMVAVIAATAFIGASSASAILCKTNENPCAAGNQYPSHTTVLVSSPAVKIQGTFGAVLCASHATLLYEGIKDGKLFGILTLLDWTSCKVCSPVTTTALGSFDDEATGGGNGRLLPLNTAILLKDCPFGAHCTVLAINGTTALTLTGGTINGTAQITANTQMSVHGGFACGSKAELVTEKPYIVLSVNGATTGSIFWE
jgi:hypothetical protein